MSRITVKGQVTIPKSIRDIFGIKPGDRVDFNVENGRVFIEFRKGTILDAITRKPEESSTKKSSGGADKK